MIGGSKAWLRTHPSVSLGVSALFLSAGSSFFTVNLLVAIPLVGVSGLFGIVGVSMRDREQTSVGTLTSELAGATSNIARLEALVVNAHPAVISTTEGLLQAIGMWAGLTSDGRVSLYCLSGMGWERRARYSANLSYMYSGRSTLPIGQGAVHQAHLVGEFSIDNLPAFEDAPDAYLLEQKKLGIAKAVAKDLNMRTRSYVCFGFGRDGRSRPHVLVFESTDANGLDSQTLRNLLHREAEQVLSDLLDLGSSLKAIR